MPDRHIVSYAYDTVLLAEDDDLLGTKNKMKSYLHKDANWFILNKLLLNITKTVFITIGNNSNSVPITPPLQIKVHQLTWVNSF